MRNESVLAAHRVRPGVILSCGSEPDRTVVEVRRIEAGRRAGEAPIGLDGAFEPTAFIA